MKHYITSQFINFRVHDACSLSVGKYFKKKKLRKIKTFFVFTAIMACSVANAQKTLPFLTEGKEWHCIYEVNHKGNHSIRDKWPYTVTVGGDTIIDGTTYKKILKQYTDPAYMKDPIVYFAYEKEGEVFFRDFDSKVAKLIDRSILNFNLHKGDVVEPERFGAEVIDEDYITVRGIRRRRLKLKIMARGHSEFYWIEGIGCNDIKGLILPDLAFIVSGDEEQYVLSCYENGKLIFSKEDFDEATSVMSVSGDGVHDGKIFNVSGMEISKPEKGLYIKNGHKYLKK